MMQKLLRVIIVGATLVLAGVAGTWSDGDPPRVAAQPAADAPARSVILRLASVLP